MHLRQKTSAYRLKEVRGNKKIKMKNKITLTAEEEQQKEQRKYRREVRAERKKFNLAVAAVSRKTRLTTANECLVDLVALEFLVDIGRDTNHPLFQALSEDFFELVKNESSYRGGILLIKYDHLIERIKMIANLRYEPPDFNGEFNETSSHVPRECRHVYKIPDGDIFVDPDKKYDLLALVPVLS